MAEQNGIAREFYEHKGRTEMALKGLWKRADELRENQGAVFEKLDGLQIQVARLAKNGKYNGRFVQPRDAFLIAIGLVGGGGGHEAFHFLLKFFGGA